MRGIIMRVWPVFSESEGLGFSEDEHVRSQNMLISKLELLNNHNDVEKVKWTEQENIKLLETSDDIGGNINEMMKALPGKTEDQIKVQFTNLMRDAVSRLKDDLKSNSNYLSTKFPKLSYLTASDSLPMEPLYLFLPVAKYLLYKKPTSKFLWEKLKSSSSSSE
jgi:hypothetical protein